MMVATHTILTMSVYFLISYDLFDEISDIRKFVVHDRIDSDHMPVTLYLSLKYNDDKYAQEKDKSVMKISRFMWSDELAKDFNNMLCSDEM